MPRFYFHLRSPAGLDRDDIGLDLEGVEAAYLDACASVPSMIMDLLQRNASPYQHTFEIVDSSGNLLTEVPFAEQPRGSHGRLLPSGDTDRTRPVI